MTPERLAAWVTIVGLPLLIASVIFAWFLDSKVSAQLVELNQIAQSQNSIALNTMFFNDSSNIGIINAMEDGSPILVQNGGQFSHAALDKYLGDFDTIDLVFDAHLISEDQFCDSFSTYISETASSSEISAYLNSKGNSGYFGGFEELRGVVERSQDPNCSE